MIRLKLKKGNFSVQLQWQPRSPVYKVTKEISQNTGS